MVIIYVFPRRLPPRLQGTSAFTTVLSALLLTNWRKGDYKDILSPKTGGGCTPTIGPGGGYRGGRAGG